MNEENPLDTPLTRKHIRIIAFLLTAVLTLFGFWLGVDIYLKLKNSGIDINAEILPLIIICFVTIFVLYLIITSILQFVDWIITRRLKKKAVSNEEL